MTDDINVNENLDDRDQDLNYEAPKLEVLGTVEQLTSEFDTTEPPK
jgi:hypothetical protein